MFLKSGHIYQRFILYGGDGHPNLRARVPGTMIVRHLLQ